MNFLSFADENNWPINGWTTKLIVLFRTFRKWVGLIFNWTRNWTYGTCLHLRPFKVRQAAHRHTYGILFSEHGIIGMNYGRRYCNMFKNICAIKYWAKAEVSAQWIQGRGNVAYGPDGELTNWGSMINFH